MKRILRLGLSVVLATVLAVTAAWAVEYDDIFELTERGVSERTIVQLIVDDGRAFELDQDELADLRAAGVSEAVIAAMLDPAVGRAWLAGGVSSSGGSGYSTSLDEAYNQGYSAGVSSTALVYSFGYYYGPLSRYYYNDPFYYPFWYSGYYGYSYWPSYYSYWYRPYYDCYYAYPYNWYGYSSYYCHSYYDAGYWGHNGYYVPPGYGHSVWDNGPRFRGGGVTPPKGGRPDGEGANSRLVTDTAGRMRNVTGPPAIREAEGGRAPSDRGGAGSGLATRTGRGVDTPSARTPSSRGSSARVIRGSEGGSTSGGSSTARVIRGSGATRGAERSTGGERVARSEPRRLRDSADRVMRSGRTGSNRRSAWGDVTGSSRIVRPYGRTVADGRAGMVGRGATARVERAAGYSRPGGGSKSAAPQARSGGGGSAPSGGGSHGGGRSGGAPSGGGGSRGGGSHGGGGGSRGGR